MRNYLFAIALLAGCTDPGDETVAEVAAPVITHAPGTAKDLTARPASDGSASANIATWPTGSSMFAAIGEAVPASPPDQSLVKTLPGTGNGFFTVGLGLKAGYDIGQVAVTVQHSVANGATTGSVQVVLVYSGSEVATKTVASSTAWTTSTVTFARADISGDIIDASKLQLRFYLSTGATGNVRVAYAAADVWKLKPFIAGAMTTGYSLGGSAVPSQINDAALDVDWSDLEGPDQVFTGPGWTTIQNAINSGKGIRLRVMAGMSAPGFILAKCSVTVTNPQSGRTAPVPCFWQASYQAQYEELMREVARRYDGIDEIREVVDSACMTTFAEPFVRAHNDPTSNANLLKAGYTFAGDQGCHEAALDVMNNDFVRTRTSLALNPWDEPCSGCTNNVRHSFPDTASFVLDNDHARPTLGRKLVVQANHLNWQYKCGGGDSYSSDACLIANEAGPKGFQTTMNDLLCDHDDATCNTYAITLGGQLEGLEGALKAGQAEQGWFVEISTGFAWSTINQTDFTARDAALEGYAK